MKKILYLILLIAAGNLCYAQGGISYQYSDNKEDFKKQDDIYKPKSSGAQYCTKVAEFKTMAAKSMKTYLTRSEMNEFAIQFEALANRPGAVESSYTAQKLKGFAHAISQLNRLYSGDAYRNMLYKQAYPVYKAVDESWEDDIVRAMLSDGHLELVDYFTTHSNDNEDLNGGMNIIDNNLGGMAQTGDACTYTVLVDSQLAKGSIEIYFCDDALFRKATANYGGRLLYGPITDWKDRKGESEIVATVLNSHLSMDAHSSFYIYNYKTASLPNKTKLEQKLMNNMDWYVLIFRDGRLYYSYLVTPCSKLNTCKIK